MPLASEGAGGAGRILAFHGMGRDLRGDRADALHAPGAMPKP